jgi:hypothetical protein
LRLAQFLVLVAFFLVFLPTLLYQLGVLESALEVHVLWSEQPQCGLDLLQLNVLDLEMADAGICSTVGAELSYAIRVSLGLTCFVLTPSIVHEVAGEVVADELSRTTYSFTIGLVAVTLGWLMSCNLA